MQVMEKALPGLPCLFDQLFIGLINVHFRPRRAERKNTRPWGAAPQRPPPAATPGPRRLRRTQRRTAAPPERSGARRSAAQRRLDMQLRMQ